MPPSSRRWAVLAVGVLAQTGACAFVYGIPFLVPTLRDTLGLSLAGVGVYVAAPTTGLLLTLIAWGATADRFGERRVMGTGLLLTAAAVGAVAIGPTSPAAVLTLLVLGGAAAASVFAANGRMIMGWFPRSERGLAMGIRQTAQPLGVAVAGLVLPGLAIRVGPFAALIVPAAVCLVAAVLVGVVVRDPARPPQDAAHPVGTPYRSPVLWRVHAASALLVVPQFAIAAFGTEYLVRQQGWGVAAAGAFMAVVQIAGAVGRIATGVWSDRARSRLRPMRQLAVGATLVLLVLALGDAVAPWLAVVALAVGGVVTVADNGLAFTAVAEIAGSAWSGKALGIQNTGQNVVSSLTPVVLGGLIGVTGYAAGFALAAVAPLLAVGITPVRDETPPTW
ncbi:MFS transporter [Pseudonocardia oroxyli]|uniref:Sugar phosphate permease n=1 Tax=Pseudonocardia oroxyli TaxID=366584 RepID=A0A1G7W510_PSEOR|nr:MFS transporter [Pseudonocardia oroxyli]SDG67085.1 Sugar phosphate permease [Pseudonocardia oroxyli]